MGRYAILIRKGVTIACNLTPQPVIFVQKNAKKTQKNAKKRKKTQKDAKKVTGCYAVEAGVS
jgi:hypothetical protein